MQFPITVEFDFRMPQNLRRAARARRAQAIAACLIGVLILFTTWLVSRHDEPQVGNANLMITSSPSGASILVDGRARGETPAQMSLPTGDHRVALRLDQFAEETKDVTLSAEQDATVHADLWLRSPAVKRLRPIFPGASIGSATFLHDGSIALVVSLPSTDERQLWVTDLWGETRRLGPPFARGTIVVSSDGQNVAYLAARQDGTDGRLDQVWLWHPDGQTALAFALSAASGDERLVDLTFAPEGRRLLVLSRQQLAAGATRTRVRFLDVASGAAQDVVTLPTDIVPGSYAWSPDGAWVGLLTRSGQLTSLCLLQPRSGKFTYLADLSRDDPSPSSFPTLAWSSDSQRVLYAAPAQDRSASGWSFGKASPSFFVVPVDEGASPVRLEEEEGQAATWRNDGSIALLDRKSSSVVAVRTISPSGRLQLLAELPIKASAGITARWDTAHAQVLMSSPASLAGGQLDYWLVQFQPEMAR